MFLILVRIILYKSLSLICSFLKLGADDDIIFILYQSFLSNKVFSLSSFLNINTLGEYIILSEYKLPNCLWYP